MGRYGLETGDEKSTVGRTMSAFVLSTPALIQKPNAKATTAMAIAKRSAYFSRDHESAAKIFPLKFIQTAEC